MFLESFGVLDKHGDVTAVAMSFNSLQMAHK
jgi:hypothetical protein